MAEIKTMDGASTMPATGLHAGPGRFSKGYEILGRYVVESELGQGGMGVVYECFDKIGGVKVAVKGLPPDVAHNAGEMEEIRANFQLVCDLRHPNIAGVRTLEKDAAGDYYLVMDLAHGDDLGKWMRENKNVGIETRLSIIRQIADALDYAHARKVMHRDIKPGNILISPKGRVQLLDFGLAAQISTSLSRTSRLVVAQSGTPAYKSPEQWRGNPQGAPADQYALAVVAYRLLSGRLPFDGDNVLIFCRAVLEERPPAIKGLPSYINKALARALAKNPRDRFPTCVAFADALEGRQRSRCGAKVAAALLVAALGAAGFVFLRRNNESVPPKPPEATPPPVVEKPLPSVQTNTPPPVVKPPVATPPPVVEKPLPPVQTTTPPPVVKPPEATPPPVVEKPLPPVQTNTPPAVVKPPVATPPPVVEKPLPPVQTNTPPAVVKPPVATPPPVMVEPAPPETPPPPLSAEARKAAEACSSAQKEQERAKAAGCDSRDPDGWSAACKRMVEAERLGKAGDFKKAKLEYTKAALAFERLCEKANGK